MNELVNLELAQKRELQKCNEILTLHDVTAMASMLHFEL